MICEISLSLLVASAPMRDLSCSQLFRVEPRVRVVSLETYVPQRHSAAISPVIATIERTKGKMSLLVVETRGGTVRTSVAAAHAGDFACLINKLSAEGYPIRDVGCYSNRFIAGTRYKSLHAFGLACDINQDGRNDVSPPFPPNVNALAHGCGLFPGAEWRYTPDNGHFQVAGAQLANGRSVDEPPHPFLGALSKTASWWWHRGDI